MGRQHGDHNAPHPVGLGHQREEKLETTSRGPDRLWSAVKTTPLGNAGRAKPSRCDKQPSPAREVATKPQSNTDRKTRETDSPALSRPPPCRTRRHSAAATESTVRRSGNHQIWTSRWLPLSRHRENTTHGGLASPAVGRHLSSPRRRHRTRGPRHFRLSTPSCHATRVPPRARACATCSKGT